MLCRQRKYLEIDHNSVSSTFRWRKQRFVSLFMGLYCIHHYHHYLSPPITTLYPILNHSSPPTFTTLHHQSPPFITFHHALISFTTYYQTSSYPLSPVSSLFHPLQAFTTLYYTTFHNPSLPSPSLTTLDHLLPSIYPLPPLTTLHNYLLPLTILF